MTKIPFIEKNEFFGAGSILNVSKILNEGNFKHLLLVTGNESYKNSGLKKSLEPQIKNIDFKRINDFEINPKYEDIERIGQSLRSTKFDFIIAAGGGSVIDFAKCLNAYLSTEGHKGAEEIIKESPMNQALPMLAIPSTAGTGSEATHFAVMYINKKKFSISNINLRPKYVIVDPEFTYNSPSYITACCSFDALSQAIESLWSKNSTDESRLYSEKAISLISSSMTEAINKNCSEARANLSFGSFLAGKAINISKTTAPHALSYSLTSTFNIPHGNAVAMTLGQFFTINNDKKFYKHVSKKIGVRNHQENLLKIKENMGLELDENFELHWLNLMKRCGLKTKIKNVEKDGFTIKQLTQTVNIDRLSNHPIRIGPEIISSIYSKLF